MIPESKAALQDNRLRWDELVPHHISSDHYDLRGFLLGGCSLAAIELAELGSVAGKSLLHTQCHFGMDTLSWARRGASVTGVDFSEAAIIAARKIAERLDLDARFEVAEVTQMGSVLGDEMFDIVFTSWGVLTWIPDVTAWARALVERVAPGGTFYLLEVHPIVWTYDPQDEAPADSNGRSYDYFRTDAGFTVEAGGSYAVDDIDTEHTREHFWTYELGEVITALLQAGLTLEYVHEHDALNRQALPSLELGEDGLWRQPSGVKNLPLSFSIRGTRGVGG
ncbi:MAG: class I SAM-dependent methyltransferase [Myxococcota bacterium]